MYIIYNIYIIYIRYIYIYIYIYLNKIIYIYACIKNIHLLNITTYSNGNIYEYYYTNYNYYEIS